MAIEQHELMCRLLRAEIEIKEQELTEMRAALAFHERRLRATADKTPTPTRKPSFAQAPRDVVARADGPMIYRDMASHLTTLGYGDKTFMQQRLGGYLSTMVKRGDLRRVGVGVYVRANSPAAAAIAAEAEQSKRQTRSRFVLDLLRDKGQLYYGQIVAHAVKAGLGTRRTLNSSLGATILRMVRNGLLQRPEIGLYKLPDETATNGVAENT